MKEITLKAQSRTDLGKKASRDARRAGNVPAVVYGVEKEEKNGKQIPVAKSILVNEKELNKAVFTPNVYIVNLDLDGQVVKTIIQDLQVDFVKDNPYPTLMIKVDANRLTQVITNFLTNAVKYTHQGHIKLGYHLETRTKGGEQHEGLYLYCEDTGDGIPLENQSKIFERFYKVNDYIQGTGLGLAICKAFADACHGDIGVMSEGIGKGCTFWMWIPL